MYLKSCPESTVADHVDDPEHRIVVIHAIDHEVGGTDRELPEGRYFEGATDSGAEKRAAIFIGPEFGTVSRPDLVAAAREAGDAGFDVLIALRCSFGRNSISPVLKS